MTSLHTTYSSTECPLLTSVFNTSFLDSYNKCVPGEVHLGYFLTSCVVPCTCILPVVIFGGHNMFLSLCRKVIRDADGHFLLHFLCPITLTCFLILNG